MSDRRSRTIAPGFLAGLLLLVPLPAAAQIRLVEQQRVQIKVWPMAIDIDDERSLLELEVIDNSTDEIDVEIPWPSAEAPSRLVLRAGRREAPAGVSCRIRLESEVTTADGQTMMSQRVLDFDDSAKALFEAARIGDQPMTLAIQAEADTRMIPATRSTVGPPVQFLLEIQHVSGGNAVTLETNRLNTFVGEPVIYSFKLGETGHAESVQIQLLPVQVLGALARIEIDVTATLPGEGNEPILFSRNEEWATTRGAVSSLTIETGEPPSGFRFLVTPTF